MAAAHSALTSEELKLWTKKQTNNVSSSIVRMGLASINLCILLNQKQIVWKKKKKKTKPSITFFSSNWWEIKKSNHPTTIGQRLGQNNDHNTKTKERKRIASKYPQRKLPLNKEKHPQEHERKQINHHD